MAISDSSQLLFLAAAAVSLLVAAALRFSRRSLKDIRGPACSSLWLGNQGDIRYQVEVGDVEFSWLNEFGGAWKLHGPLGEEQLALADPKAIQYVLQTSGYNFPKAVDRRENIRMVAGDGIVYVHGEQHKRHRKIMNPAFTVPQLKSFLPLFIRYAEKLAEKWKTEELTPAAGNEPILNVHRWLSRTTLDVVGDAGFNFQFDALDNAQSELSRVYENLFIDSTLYPHRLDIVFRSLWKYFPASVIRLVRYLPSREYARFRHYQDFIRKFGRGLVKEAQASSKADGKDVMSVLLRANEAEESQLKLSDKEVVDQISTILLAGHDTTAGSLIWWFWELAKHPDWQARVREEIQAVRRTVAERGDTAFSIGDLEGMSVMHATLKEAMRLHPIIWTLNRTAGKDDVIPLATPVTTWSGQQISSIPVRKGQALLISIAAYNRNPDVWGADAGSWNPDRFTNLNKGSMTSVGLYANLLNFSAGIRGCIGWRFSVLEMQAIAATLIENFEFALPPQTKENMIKRKPANAMVPMTEGRPGVWMGLKVKACGST